jgi:hypothetical protein
MASRRKSGGVREGSSLPASSPTQIEKLDAMIASLVDLDADQLRLQWRNHLGGAAPAHLPRWLFQRVLAHCIQSATLGDLDKATQRLLRRSEVEQVGSPNARPFETRGASTRGGIRLKPGALLVREWRDRLERVMVLEAGFAWNGETYGSLSHIAKAMTGTNWNGHRFFGLRSAKGQSRGERTSHPSAANKHPPADSRASHGRGCGEPEAIADRNPRPARPRSRHEVPGS